MAHQPEPHRHDHDDEVEYAHARETRYDVEDVEVVDRAAHWYDLDIPGRVNGVLFTFLFALEGLLATRFLLVLFGANRTSGFVDFVLDLSWPFVRPFDGAFADRTWDEGIIEVSTLLAMLVWAIVVTVAAMLVNALLSRDAAIPSGRVRRRRVHRTMEH